MLEGIYVCVISVLEFNDNCLLCGCLHYPTPIPLRRNLLVPWVQFEGAAVQDIAALTASKNDQDGHFFYNHPERGAYSAA